MNSDDWMVVGDRLILVLVCIAAVLILTGVLR